MINIVVGPSSRCAFVLNSRVFSRHTKGIPTHGLQDLFAQHALVAADDIADGVVAYVSHVQLAAGIGQHA